MKTKKEEEKEKERERERKRERERELACTLRSSRRVGGVLGRCCPPGGGGVVIPFSLEEVVSPETNLGLLWPSSSHFQAYLKKASEQGRRDTAKKTKP